jgi:hypothetical protein
MPSHPRPCLVRRAALAVLALAASAGAAPPEAASESRVHLVLDTAQADAVLAILEKRSAGRPPDAADWERLLSSTPQVRLAKRERSMGRPFEAQAFREFVLSGDLSRRAPALRRTLADWRKADLEALGRRVLAYLPEAARIRARVYPVIKPRDNSFVFELDEDPAIFLSLDPALDRARFENTVAHELHHVGFASLGDRSAALGSLPAPARRAAEWLSAFGEGFAMLAAAGGPDVHPHASSPASDRERWDRDVARFDQDRARVERFLLDVAEGRLADEARIREAGFEFFGVQGAWYTVGWRMAVEVERRLGRPALVECMSDPRQLLLAFNRLAADPDRPVGERLSTWSPALLTALGVAPPRSYSESPHVP